MLTFSYRGYTAGGERREGLIEADGRKAALRQLSEAGVFAEKLEPLQRSTSLAAARRAVLYREVGVLLGAGLELEGALQLLMNGSENRHSIEQSILAQARDSLRDGRTVAESLNFEGASSSAYEQSVLAAAERTATLPEMLVRLADEIDSRRTMLENMRSAALYPAFVLLLGIVIAVLLLGFLVPRAHHALLAGGLELPGMSIAIVSAARWTAWVSGILLVSAGIAGLLLFRLRRQNDRLREITDRKLLHSPLLRNIATRIATTRFASTLAVLLRAGVQLVEALPLAGAATGNLWLERRVHELSTQVRHGMTLEKAIDSIPVLAVGLSEWIRVGEAGGCLEDMLQTASLREQTQWERSIKRILTLFEPVVLVLVGLFVLAVALAVLLPVVSITRGVL